MDRREPSSLREAMRVIAECLDESNHLVGSRDCDASPDTARTVAELMSRLRGACEALHDQLNHGSRETPVHETDPSESSPAVAMEKPPVLEAALRALGRVRGTVLVVERESWRVVCTSLPVGDDHRRPEGGRLGRAVLAGLRRLLARGAMDVDAIKAPLRLRGATILEVVEFGAEVAQASGRRYLAVRVAPTNGRRGAPSELSPRERDVARLLADGYSHVNIAALWGVSTNTGRTLMRRLYRKLGVCNRADLVREILRLSASA